VVIFPGKDLMVNALREPSPRPSPSRRPFKSPPRNMKIKKSMMKMRKIYDKKYHSLLRNKNRGSFLLIK
jgi:hypothetical protein